MGYSPMPVAPRCEPLFEGHRPPTGKEPGRLELRPEGDRVWFRLKKWTIFCKRQAKPEIIAHWSRWPDAGVCVATGFNNLIAVDIDRDDLIADILAVLPGALVGKVGKRGATYFFRSDGPMPSTAYKDSEKRGLLDFLSIGRQSAIPGTIHPDLGRPYRWLTPATLFNTPLADLPLFTREHRAEMERVLRKHGWDAPEPRVARSKAVAERPVWVQSAAVVGDGWWPRFLAEVKAARAQWLPKLGLHRLEQCPEGWKSVASFRPSSSGKPLAERNQNLWVYNSGPIKDYAGEDHNDISLVAVCLFGSRKNTKPAIAWLREEIGFDDTPTVIEPPAAPTYEDNRVPLDGALKYLVDVFGDGFKDAILASRAARADRAAYEALDANDPKRRKTLMLPYDHPVEIIPTETGLGKTRAAREALTSLTKLGFKFVYAVPYHDLADDVAADFRAMPGMTKESIEVYRAYDRPDPRAPKKHKMCRRPEGYEAVRALGISPHNTICETKPDLVPVRCPHASRCGLMRQRKATPDIWIVPNALLFTPKPVFFPEIDALVIDEGFIDNAIGVPFEFDVQAHNKAPIEKSLYNPAEQDKLTLFRHRLRDAIKENGDGPLSRAVLLDHEIDCDTAWWLGRLEHRPLDSVDLSPDMPDREVRSAANKFKAKATQARNASTMWDEISTFLGEHWAEDFYGPRSLSGRLTVEDGTLFVKPFRTVHPSWRDAPLAYLDATPPPTRLVELALGEVVTYGLPSPVSRQADITAKWSTHVRVRQILDGPATMTKVGVGAYARKQREKQGKKEELKKGNVDDIISYIQLQAALAYPARVGVITFKELRERLAEKLPSNIEWMHYGAVAGRNNMEKVTGLIVIGRLSAQRRAVEALASVFAGYPISGDSNCFEHKTGGIRRADGTVQGVRMERHRDPIAEAVRWLITEGNLIQAIGRLRPHRRDAPCWLDIITDVPLPITVDETAQWGDVKPGAVGAMALGGVVLTNASDAKTAFGFGGKVARGLAPLSNRIYPNREGYDSSPIRRFIYQKEGPSYKTYESYMLPAIIGGETGLRTWLVDKLGPLAMLDVERVRVRDLLKTEAGRAKLDKIWRDSTINKVMRTTADIVAQLTRPLLDVQMLTKIIEKDIAALSEADEEEEPDETEIDDALFKGEQEANGPASG